MPKRRNSFWAKALRCFISLLFILDYSGAVRAADLSGALDALKLLGTTPAFTPLTIKGLKLYSDDPFKFDFLIEEGDTSYSDARLKEEAQKLVDYFLVSLTIPEDDLWVNFSPYEQDRIIPSELSRTGMGKDMLEQDYILKQLASSLTYPEKAPGKKYWNEINGAGATPRGRPGQAQGSVPTVNFQKIWIVPDKAVVYTDKDHAYVGEASLKVMMAEDYAAQNNYKSPLDDTRGRQITDYKLGNDRLPSLRGGSKADDEAIAGNAFKRHILPLIEKEVNHGLHFARLRQMYKSLILATWFKRHLKENIINRLYSDQKKIKGVDLADPQAKEKIYNQYLESCKKGVYDYIGRNVDAAAHKIGRQRYFSGGLGLRIGNLGDIPEVTLAPGQRSIAEGHDGVITTQLEEATMVASARTKALRHAVKPMLSAKRWVAAVAVAAVTAGVGVIGYTAYNYQTAMALVNTHPRQALERICRWPSYLDKEGALVVVQAVMDKEPWAVLEKFPQCAPYFNIEQRHDFIMAGIEAVPWHVLYVGAYGPYLDADDLKKTLEVVQRRTPALFWQSAPRWIPILGEEEAIKFIEALTPKGSEDGLRYAGFWAPQFKKSVASRLIRKMIKIAKPGSWEHGCDELPMAWLTFLTPADAISSLRQIIENDLSVLSGPQLIDLIWELTDVPWGKERLAQYLAQDASLAQAYRKALEKWFGSGDLWHHAVLHTAPLWFPYLEHATALTKLRQVLKREMGSGPENVVETVIYWAPCLEKKEAAGIFNRALAELKRLQAINGGRVYHDSDLVRILSHDPRFGGGEIHDLVNKLLPCVDAWMTYPDGDHNLALQVLQNLISSGVKERNDDDIMFLADIVATSPRWSRYFSGESSYVAGVLKPIARRLSDVMQITRLVEKEYKYHPFKGVTETMHSGEIPAEYLMIALGWSNPGWMVGFGVEQNTAYTVAFARAAARQDEAPKPAASELFANAQKWASHVDRVWVKPALAPLVKIAAKNWRGLDHEPLTWDVNEWRDFDLVDAQAISDILSVDSNSFEIEPEPLPAASHSRLMLPSAPNEDAQNGGLDLNRGLVIEEKGTAMKNFVKPGRLSVPTGLLGLRARIIHVERKNHSRCISR